MGNQIIICGVSFEKEHRCIKRIIRPGTKLHGTFYHTGIKAEAAEAKTDKTQHIRFLRR